MSYGSVQIGMRRVPKRKKRKSDLCIAIYEFCTEYYGCMSDIAIIRESRSSVCGINVDGNLMFHMLGFNSSNDYINSYPGQFNDESGIVKTYMIEEDDEYYSPGGYQCEYGNIRVYIEDEYSSMYEYFKRHDRHCCGLWDHFTLNPIPFIVPTLEELSECISIKRFKHNDLWFCSDWSENNNS